MGSMVKKLNCVLADIVIEFEYQHSQHEVLIPLYLDRALASLSQLQDLSSLISIKKSVGVSVSN